MALFEIEIRRCERDLARFMERRRPPAHSRARIDLGYRISGQSVEIFEMRSDGAGAAATRESPVAKATYVRSRNHWRIYWMRGDLKWHGYEPTREVRFLEEFLNIVDRDDYCCFFG